MKLHTAVKVTKLPACDICGQPAHYDARSIDGRWGYFCPQHFQSHTWRKLGLGFGQQLILEQKEPTNDNR